MTYLDMIEIYNLRNGYEIDDYEKIIDDADIDGRIDKEVLATCLLDECGAMECLYTNSSLFKRFSDNFFKKYKWNIKKLLDSLDLEYNPLNNRSVSWEENTVISQVLNTEEDNTQNKTKENTGTQVTEYGDIEQNDVSAMNSDDYQPDTKTTTSGDNTRTDDLTEEITTTNDKNKNETLDWTETDTHEEHGTNNTDYQDLIEKESKVAQFSIYGWISRKYATELFLLVY